MNCLERKVKKMIILPIKKKWYDMIVSGEKKRGIPGNQTILDNQDFT